MSDELNDSDFEPKITDTTQEREIHTMGLMSMVMGSDAILHQERRGQQEVCAQSGKRIVQLPKEGFTKESRFVFEHWGFLWFGDQTLKEIMAEVHEEKLEGHRDTVSDPLFGNAIMPPGWSIKPTGHHMYSDIVDDRGQKRAVFGYKAAFYDRWVSLYPIRRIQYATGYSDSGYSHVLNRSYGPPKKVRGTVRTSNGDILFATDWVDEGEERFTREDAPIEKYWGSLKSHYAIEVEAQAWLEANFPDHNEVLSYWDVDLKPIDAGPIPGPSKEDHEKIAAEEQEYERRKKLREEQERRGSYGFTDINGFPVRLYDDCRWDPYDPPKPKKRRK